MGGHRIDFLAVPDGRPELPWVAMAPLLDALGFDEPEKIRILADAGAQIPSQHLCVVDILDAEVIAVTAPLAAELVRVAMEIGPAEKSAGKEFQDAFGNAVAHLAVAQAPHSPRDYMSRARAFSYFGE